VRLKTLPTSAVVLGAGIEGIEAAALLAKYGCPEVSSSSLLLSSLELSDTLLYEP